MPSCKTVKDETFNTQGPLHNHYHQLVPNNNFTSSAAVPHQVNVAEKRLEQSQNSGHHPATSSKCANIITTLLVLLVN